MSIVDTKGARVLFKLVEGVVMTDAGLLKRCSWCGELLPLAAYPEDGGKAYKRGNTCMHCISELHKEVERGI